MTLTKTETTTGKVYDALGITGSEYNDAIIKALRILNNDKIESVADTVLELANAMTKEELAVAITNNFFTQVDILTHIGTVVDHFQSAIVAACTEDKPGSNKEVTESVPTDPTEEAVPPTE